MQALLFVLFRGAFFLSLFHLLQGLVSFCDKLQRNSYI
jgi:hypothetical protein